MRAEARISLSVTLVTAVALASALVLIHFALNRFQERRFDAALVEVAQRTARTASGPRSTLSSVVDEFAVVYAESGAVLAATRAPELVPALPKLGPVLGEPFDFRHGGKTLRGVRLPLGPPGRASLLVAAARDDLDGDDEFLDHAMLLAFVASMLSLFVCSRWLTKRFTAEHRRIAATLHSVAHGDLHARALEGSKDPDLEQWRLDLNEVAEQLSALIPQQRRFIANAAHELRSPVTALYGELQQSLRQERRDADYRASIEHALRAARRLARLTDDLLTLARAEHSSQPLEAVSLEQLFDEVSREVAPAAGEKQVRLESSLAVAEVRGRARDLQRLLRNLLDNALRHSPSGGRVCCAASARGGWVTLRVSDEGPGVAPQDRERVFEPFFRSPELRGSREGAGLGLSIAREIVRAHGGEIWIEDSARGAVFALSLPIVTPARRAPRDREPPPLTHLVAP